MSAGNTLPGGTLSGSGTSSTSSVGRLGADAASFLPPPDEAIDDLGPVPRDRCNTWPLRRPQLDINAQTSPLIHEQIPEEETDIYDSSENLGRLGASSAASAALLHSPDGNNTFSPGMSSPVMNGVPPSGASDTSDPGCPPGSKKSTTRRNAWGNMSYADLITQAIIQSPEKRLTLSQVYEWMVQNVPYFRDKGDSNSSAGWKSTNYSMEASVSLSIDDDFPPEPRGRCYTWPMQQFVYDPVLPEHSMNPSMLREPTVAQLLAATPSSSAMGTHLMPLGMPLTGGPTMPPKKKRCRKKPADQLAQKKPNPWGEESYSDIIAKALESAPDGRLKLNEIYQWFSDNIPYFRERSSQEDAAGWKNSIRHNLSLHSRFMRIQNEGAGKSSWWVINPDAKPGRNPRRQRASTLDATNKAAIEKKRRGARKKVMDMRVGVGGLHSGVSSLAGSQASIMSHDIYADEESMQATFDPMFRPRAQSNMSVPGSSARVSPSMDHQFGEDFDFPPWVDAASAGPIPSDILDRTDQMRIDPCRAMMNGTGVPVKHDTKMVKTENVVPPPSYHELNSVRSQSQLQNPILRTQLAGKFQPTTGIPLYQSYAPWMPAPGQLATPHSCAAAQQSMATALPIDLENLTLPDQPLMEMDVESLLRHELSQTRDHQINFDNI